MSNPNIFGAVCMGYALIESRKLLDWKRFGQQGLGLHLAEASDALLAFRMDQHARRLIITKGPAEDFVAVGWQLRDQPTLDIVLARLANRGIPVETGTADEAELRGVRSFVRIRGPKGLPLELFVDAVTTNEPLNMLASGFVTGDAGMGHVAITSRKPEKMERFWQEIFDARLSDRISQAMAGVVLDVGFLRLNERHHSVAVAATRGVRLDPVRTQVQHMNLLAASKDDLTNAYERLTDLGYEMAHEIGQHPNDREVSFYVLTPSGFEIELGWDALTVDEASWKTTHYDAISIWGHKPQNASTLAALRLNAGNFRRGLLKALRPEFSPID